MLANMKSRFHVDAGGFLNEVEIIEVFSGRSRLEHVRSLVEVLKTKDNASFTTLCLILRDCGYGHWSTALLEESGLGGDFKEQDSLKVSNVPKSVTEAEIRHIIANIDPNAVVRVLQVPNQPTNYGYINCSCKDVAAMIKDKLTGYVIEDYRLVVKFQQCKNCPTSPTRQPAPSLKVVNLPSTLNKEEFKGIGASEKGFKNAKFIFSEPPHGFFVFDCRDSALVACNNLSRQGYCVSLSKN